MSTLRDTDPCADVILDMISEHESFGNYNAVIGDARASDELSYLTIDGIYLLMDALLKEGNPSTAVGRYQIIRKTLKGLQANLGLSGSTRFTQALQDRLAVALMNGRGYARWKAGELSGEDLAHGLSCEWASLPDPQKGGKSHYDGVGPNHAGTTVAHVLAALERAAAARVAASAPQSPAEPPVPPPAPTPTADPFPAPGTFLASLWTMLGFT